MRRLKAAHTVIRRAALNALPLDRLALIQGDPVSCAGKTRRMIDDEIIARWPELAPAVLNSLAEAKLDEARSDPSGDFT